MLQPRSIFTGSDPAPPADPRPPAHLDRDRDHDSTPAYPSPWDPRPPPEHRPRPDSRRAGSDLPLRCGGGHTATRPAKTPPPVARRKRPPPQDRTPTPTTTAATRPPASEPLRKRRRLHTRGRHSLGPLDFARTAPALDDRPPLSPLFFSSRTTRPQLPTRFSGAAAAARMLGTAREEGGIRTLTMARGTFSGLSPPAPTSLPSGRTSERSSMARTASPDARERDPLRRLASVGVVEMLEHDGRPTFIVDMDDFHNYADDAPGLQIIFANHALRSSPAVWDSIVGRCPDSDADPDQHTSHAASQFRAWVLSTASPGESQSQSPSPVEHGGIIWSCYTLRKRLRVVSSAIPPHATSSIASTTAHSNFAIPSVSSAGLRSITSLSSARGNERQDYFGSSVLIGEPTPPKSAPPKSLALTDSPSEDGSGLCPKPSHTSLPSIEDPESVSFANECVLRAHCAGDVDSFHREPKGDAEVSHDMGFFDWTRLAISSSLPSHIQFARSVDWASTPLGPIEFWSNDLRAMCNLIM